MIEEKRLREIIREEINKYFSNKMLFEFYACQLYPPKGGCLSKG